MLKERRQAADQVATELFAAESAIDAALAAVARLSALIPSTREGLHMAPHMGHDALMKALETCGILGQARGAIIATHDALSETQRQIGLGSVRFSPKGIGQNIKPDAGIVPAPSGHLSVVAA